MLFYCFVDKLLFVIHTNYIMPSQDIQRCPTEQNNCTFEQLNNKPLLFT